MKSDNSSASHETKGLMMKKILLLTTVLAAMTATSLIAQSSDCPMHKQHADNCPMKDHAASADQHGDAVMGFAHDKTTHHFRLSATGGSIEVTANDPKDEASIAAIRSHLTAIARQFSNGNFEAPMMVHGTTPPGVETMKASNAIRYEYESLPAGGRVRLTTEDRQSIGAIHDFLRFQIEEHRTGDPTTVK
jgi:hypothetical protein